MVLFLCTLTAGAQGIDPVLTQLIQENKQTVALGKAHRLKRVAPQTVNGVDTLDVQRRVNVHFHPDGSLRQLCILGTLTEGANCPEAELEALGIKVVCTVGRLVIMDVPAEAFSALSTMQEFCWLAADRVHQVDNSKARITNNVENVITQGVPAVSGGNVTYDGTGVVVGVIDLGIDFNHVAFQNPTTGATRIKQAITFTSASNNAIVTSEASEIAKLTTGNTANSHGTHTSATTAGSYSYAPGMAPGADLVLADCSNSLSDAHIIASAKAIASYARSVNKPCVINVSLGSIAYFHDGSEANASAFSSLAQATGTPVVFCVAAGNDGNSPRSIKQTLNSGNTLKTVMGTRYRWEENDWANYADGLSAFIYATDGKEFTVEYKAVDVTTGEAYPLGTGTECKQLVNNNGSTVSLSTTVTKNKSNNKYYVNLSKGACHFTENNLRLGIFVTAGSDNQEFVITSDKSNLIGEEYANTQSDYNLPGYTDGNADMSINVIACSDDVISVGSYMDREYWSSIDGYGHYVQSYNQYGVGSIAPYSSYGVDDTGVARPDILATGTYIASAYNAYDNTYFTGDGINNRTPIDDKKGYITKVLQGAGIGDGQRPYFYGAMSGTSMATPMVTGIVALWMQKDPTLTTAGVRQLLQQTAIQDQFTSIASNAPSGNLVQAGLGKIDALRGIMALENASRTAEQSKLALDETLTMAANRNITTFSSVNQLDFRNPNGLRAYVAASYDGSTLTFSRVLSQVPANTGLLITVPASVTTTPEEAHSYNIPIATQNASTSLTNLLVGTASQAVTLNNDGEAYVLSSQNGKTGFYQNAAALTVPQGKAYLVLPDGNSGQAKAFAFAFDEDVLTPQPGSTTEGIALPEDEVLEAFPTIGGQTSGIEEINSAAPLIITDIYDLFGRRVTSPHKGLYIMGGRKVLFK